MRPTKKQIASGIDVIVVGGAADGQLLRGVNPDAQFFELSRPDYIKPLESKSQDQPEVVREKDIYELHPLSLRDSGNPVPHLFGVAVIDGQSLSWAFSQLVIGYVENVTQKLVAEGLIEKH